MRRKIVKCMIQEKKKKFKTEKNEEMESLTVAQRKKKWNKFFTLHAFGYKTPTTKWKRWKCFVFWCFHLFVGSQISFDSNAKAFDAQRRLTDLLQASSILFFFPAFSISLFLSCRPPNTIRCSKTWIGWTTINASVYHCVKKYLFHSIFMGRNANDDKARKGLQINNTSQHQELHLNNVS